MIFDPVVAQAMAARDVSSLLLRVVLSRYDEADFVNFLNKIEENRRSLALGMVGAARQVRLSKMDEIQEIFVGVVTGSLRCADTKFFKAQDHFHGQGKVHFGRDVIDGQSLPRLTAICTIGTNRVYEGHPTLGTEVTCKSCLRLEICANLRCMSLTRRQPSDRQIPCDVCGMTPRQILDSRTERGPMTSSMQSLMRRLGALELELAAQSDAEREAEALPEQQEGGEVFRSPGPIQVTPSDGFPIFGVPHSAQSEYLALPIKATPLMAQFWIDHHNEMGGKHNRKTKPFVVAKYVDRMLAKRWRRDGNTIAFDTDGRMINGGHRCLAIVESGETIETLVAVNCDPEGFATTDTGSVRTSRDILSVIDPSGRYHTEMSALARLIFVFEGGGFVGRKKTMDHEDLISLYDQRADEMIQACKAATSVYPYVRGSKASLAFAFWVIARVDLKAAFEWYEEWAKNGRSGSVGHVTARAYMLHRRTDPIHKAALVVKGYNAWVSNKNYEILGWRQHEKFPTPIQKYR